MGRNESVIQCVSITKIKNPEDPERYGMCSKHTRMHAHARTHTHFNCPGQCGESMSLCVSGCSECLVSECSLKVNKKQNLTLL